MMTSCLHMSVSDAANAISCPPGEYGRSKTKGMTRGAQAVEHVV